MNNKIMKKVITLIFSLLIISVVFSQELKDQQSKMLDFVSKTGVIIKFEDYNLPNVKASYGYAQSKIRKITSGKEAKYFLQISKSGKYDTQTASIAYEDLLEVQKALINLKEQSVKDLLTTSDYMENKFVTDDGFQIGYYVSKGKIAWYMKLEKYGSDNTVFARDYEILNDAFRLGKEKIELIKYK
ncbi:hypothetical protein JYT89_01690 [Flavobacteriaceae bacterium AH-315-B10]|nr:hypothetical protein [Flavobacteriaceae bacterium AH-315-B10]